MIAGMKKVHLVLLDRERSPGLLALRRLGVVHLHPVAGLGKELEDIGRRLTEVDRALRALSAQKETESSAPPDASAQAGFRAAVRVNELTEEARSRQEELAGLLKELERASPYGDFDPADVSALAAAGLPVRLFECPLQRLGGLPESLRFVRLASPRGTARIAIVGTPEETLPPELVEFAVPVLAPAQLRERVGAAESRLVAVGAEIADLVSAVPALEAARERLEQDLTFETVRSGMESQGPVAYLTGYVPAKDLPGLQAEARSRAWGLLSDEPQPEDLPPTKVENPPAVRIIDPVFKFLGTVPGYREYDISLWFLIFFSLYFAMIFGDGGYGVVMLVGGIIAAIKAKRAGGKLPDALRLLFVLSASTIGWGVVTATWFSIPAASLPGFVTSIAIPAFRNGNPDADTNVKIFCFILGFVQLALAHLKNIRRDFPNLKFLGQVGSLVLVTGMFMVVLNLIIDPVRFPIPMWAVASIGGGFLLVFVFGNWEGNLIKALVAGLKGIIPTFLGTVSVFADIVSYIRLWAVGLAGVAISQTVNGMATGSLGEPAGRIVAFAIGALMGVVLLVVGHGLNLVMSVLSVVVHGIRLNMLEFSGHLGMEWSGYAYEPFRETVREDSSNRKEIS